MENEINLDDLYEELLEHEGVGWDEYYDPHHPFNHKRETKRLNRIEVLKKQIQNWEHFHIFFLI